MNINFLTLYYRFILTGLLLGVLASTFVVYAQQVDEIATTTPAIFDEVMLPTEEPVIITEPEFFASTTIASSTEIVLEVATTTKAATSTTEVISTATTTVGEGNDLAITTASSTEEAVTSTEIVISPPEPDTSVTPDLTPNITEIITVTEEPSQPTLTPEECHIVTIYKQYDFRHPGECMRARGVTDQQVN